jgi:hypothetical protein
VTLLTPVEQAITDAGRSYLARHVQLPFEDIMASVFADEVEWLIHVVAARGVPVGDGSGGEP